MSAGSDNRIEVRLRELASHGGNRWPVSHKGG